MGLRVAVVGAGIGGMTAALALRANGHQAVCYDRVTNLREVGAGIQLAANATRLLYRLGLGPALEEVAAQPTRVNYRSWSSGEQIASFGMTPHSMDTFGAPHFCLHRADLHDALRRALPDEAIVLGAKAVDVRQNADSATVEFESGQAITADVVVAADGINSVIRSTLVADERRFGMRHTFRGIIPSALAPRLEDSVELWLGPQKVIVAYPICAGTSVCFAGIVPADSPITESWTSEGSGTKILERLAGWSTELTTLVSSANTLLVLPLYDRLPVSRWGRGRITLLGDAAHPMFPYLGQGAGQAIEDAWVLGKCLNDAGRDTEAALREYERLRIERTAQVQRSSSGRAWMTLPDGDEQIARDLRLSAATSEENEWLCAYDANAIQ